MRSRGYAYVKAACGCGTPDRDIDDDGVAGCQNLCPETPEQVTVSACGRPRVGVCCFPVGLCFDDLTGIAPADCSFIGGVYQGDGSDCIRLCDFGDAGQDGVVDLADFAGFQRCLGQLFDDSCTSFDANGGGTVDLDEYENFRKALTGPR